MTRVRKGARAGERKFVANAISLYAFWGEPMGTSLAPEPLLSLAAAVTSEQQLASVLQNIVKGLASERAVALSRIWLLPSAESPGFCQGAPDSLDCLRLVASAGTPRNSPSEDWSFLEGEFARIPFNVGKVGQVAASRNQSRSLRRGRSGTIPERFVLSLVCVSSKDAAAERPTRRPTCTCRALRPVSIKASKNSSRAPY